MTKPSCVRCQKEFKDGDKIYGCNICKDRNCYCQMCIEHHTMEKSWIRYSFKECEKLMVLKRLEK